MLICRPDDGWLAAGAVQKLPKIGGEDNAMQPCPREQESLPTGSLGKDHRCPITVGEENGEDGGPVRPGLRPVESTMA